MFYLPCGPYGGSLSSLEPRSVQRSHALAIPGPVILQVEKVRKEDREPTRTTAVHHARRTLPAILPGLAAGASK
jgi:hypothetical protein